MKTINSLRSKLLALTLALMASVSSFAYDFTFGNDFHIDGFAYKIISRTNPCSVALIEVADCEKHVAIPESVIYNDTTFIVTTLGMGNIVFSGTARNTMESIYIPKTIMIIVNYRALGDCPNLKSIVVDEENKYLDSRNNCNAIISSNDTYRPANQLVVGCKTTVIPNSVTEIGNYAFVRCETLENITIPEGVTRICDGAFYECTSLSSIKLPESITQLPQQWIFSGCTNLKEVFFFAKTPPYIAYGMFRGLNPTIFVPNESLDAYKKALYWQDFDIQAIPYKSQWCDTWNIFVENGSVYPPHEETYRYQLAQDTVIGDYIYTAVVSKAINDALDAPHYVAAVRFTDDRKVYIYYDNAEYLLYDFNVQQGDELEVFAGINNYRFGIKTYKCIVTGVEQYACIGCPANITLHVPNHPDDFTEIYRRTQWQEGVGDVYSGFLNGVNSYVPVDGGGSVHLLCAYQGDELKYTGPLYEKYGCEYNANDPLPLYPWCNQWNILAHGYLGPQEPLYGAKTTIYQLGGDTIINHLRYQQLTRYASDDVNQTKTYVGAIRFTKNNRQVYFYYDNAEYLLYDFKAQVGDTLEVFAGIDNYKYHKTYKHVVTNKEPIEDEQTKVTLEVIVTEEFEGNIYEEKFITTWMEGVGSPDGIVHNHATQFAGSIITDLLCAYVDDRRMYRTNTKDPFGIDYTQLGCEYNNGDFIEGAFPILSGLQRTVYDEFCGEAEIGAVYTGKQTFDKIFFENDKPYILCNDYLLREEENKILIYSQILNKDLVLYDFTLEVGDSLPALYIDYQQHNAMDWMPYNIGVVDYNKDFDGTIYPADTFVVTDVSNVTLLDGKEYKKWTFDNGMEYVEGIGMYGGRRNGNFFGLIQDVVVPCHIGTHLVCASKNNQLLYQMDDTEMERLGAECLCDYNSGPKKDNAKNGKIGGRPTPTQWNMLEVETKEMDGTPTILRAETFSYTLENDSIVANNKTYYQLARQSTKDTAITKSFVGALHFGEDEDNRVYFLRDGVEYVLYDFTAEPSDTIEIFAGINNYPQETTYTHVVTGKDTLENGACRMMLEVVFPDETSSVENTQKVWLAGLGSIDGIVHNAATRATKARSSDTQTSIMLCAWRDDNCLYTTDHPDYDTYGCVYNQDPTGVENVQTSGDKYQKILRDGHLYILRDDKIYDVLGTPMN